MVFKATEGLKSKDGRNLFTINELEERVNKVISYLKECRIATGLQLVGGVLEDEFGEALPILRYCVKEKIVIPLVHRETARENNYLENTYYALLSSLNLTPGKYE